MGQRIALASTAHLCCLEGFTHPLTAGEENLVRMRAPAELKVYFNITILSGKEKPDVARSYCVLLRLYGFMVSLSWC